MASLLQEKLAGAQVTSYEVLPSPSFEAPPPNHREQHVLTACALGQISALNLVFAASGIAAPSPAITIHNQASHTLPCTHSMVEAAVRGKQLATVQHLYATFPSARIYGPELVAAIEEGDLEVFKVLAAQAQSRYDVVHKEFADRETSLVKACKGTKPDVALWLLEQGADPNYNGASGELGEMDGPLANAVMEQELRLIEELVKRGAKVEDFHVQYAVEVKRPEVVGFLVNGTEVVADLELALMRSREEGSVEVEKVLVRRISGGKGGGFEEEHEHGFHGAWHRMKEHLHVASH